MVVVQLIVAWIVVVSVGIGALGEIGDILTPNSMVLYILAFLFRGIWIAPVVLASALVVWCLPFRSMTRNRYGRNWFPPRSWAVVCLLGAASLVFYLTGWPLGIQYQSVRYVLTSGVLGVVLFISAAALAYYGKGLTASIAAHTLFVIWMETYGFPYMGESV